MALYVFDMDGTITPPRLPMDVSFAKLFYPWQLKNKTFIATGSNFQKVEEQLPINIINAFTGIYYSMGNAYYSKGNIVYENNFIPNEALIEKLINYRNNTKYPYTLFPNFIERRIGMINFSVLGRDCPYDERIKYYNWDNVNKERENIVNELQNIFPNYDFTIGGTISIDITNKGCGKGQIAERLRNTYPNEKIIFFGDKTFKGGNDYELSLALSSLDNTEVVQVNTPEDVLKFLGIKE